MPVSVYDDHDPHILVQPQLIAVCQPLKVYPFLAGHAARFIAEVVQSALTTIFPVAFPVIVKIFVVFTTELAGVLFVVIVQPLNGLAAVWFAGVVAQLWES